MRAYRLVTAVFVAMLVTSACTQTVWAQSRERAKLLRVSGLVKVKPAASPVWVKAELPGHTSLAERDEVQTYQQARALIGIDGGRVEMGPLTHVIIPGSKSAGAGRTASRLSLLTGKILIWLIGARPLEIGTAGAIACAKSTQFVVETDEAGHSTLTVIEGVVDFYNDLGRVVVAANEQSTASADSAPTRPARADKSSYLDFEASLDNLWLGYEKLVNPGQTRESLRQNAETAAQKATAAPGDAAAQEAAGDLLHDTGNLAEAGQAYAAALQLTPGSARLGLKQGYNLLQQGEAEAAATLFAQLAAANPTSAAPLIGQAAALASSFDEAK
ncbi:MAG: FecR domain-containing protein, partial [Armatimonadota bacterium]